MKMPNGYWKCQQCGSALKSPAEYTKKGNCGKCGGVLKWEDYGSAKTIPDRLPNFDKSMHASMIIFKSDAAMETVTEQRFLYNRDRIAEYAQRDVKYIEWVAQPDCCRYCDNLYKGKRFRVADFYKNLRPSGTNQGLLKSQWSPYVFIAHPYCRCRPKAVYA